MITCRCLFQSGVNKAPPLLSNKPKTCVPPDSIVSKKESSVEYEKDDLVPLIIKDDDEEVECYDVNTDLSTVNNIISIVAEEESVSSDVPKSSKDSLDNTSIDSYIQQEDRISEQTSPFSFVVQAFSIHSSLASLTSWEDLGNIVSSDSGAVHATQSYVNGNYVSISADIEPSLTQTPVERLSLPDLFMTGVSMIVVFFILQMQLFLVSKFPGDISTVSGSHVAPSPHRGRPFFSRTGMKEIKSEVVVLYRLLASVIANRCLESTFVSTLFKLPRCGVKLWIHSICAIFRVSLWPCRLTWSFVMACLELFFPSSAGRQKRTRIPARSHVERVIL